MMTRFTTTFATSSLDWPSVTTRLPRSMVTERGRGHLEKEEIDLSSRERR
jgi:hypothetical protein